MKPLISVIVPIYNAEKHLRRCIDSIINQTYQNLQIILVDDGSTDGSDQICDEYAKADNRLVVVHKDNSGVSDTRNVGLDIAEGDYIGFVDADDYIEPLMYDKLYNELVKNNAEICCCGYIQEYEKYEFKKCCEEKVEYYGVIDILDAYFRQDCYTGIGDGNWNKLFSYKVVDGHRYAKVANGEDINFQFNVFIECQKLVCIPDLMYHYVCNGNSASNGKYTKNKESILDVADIILKMILIDYKEIVEQAYAFNLTWYISLLQKICFEKKNESATECRRRIRNKLIKNFKYYYKNNYSKRLDQYYLLSEMFGLTELAIIVHKIVSKIKLSRDV